MSAGQLAERLSNRRFIRWLQDEAILFYKNNDVRGMKSIMQARQPYSNTIKINGLRLPDVLVAAIESGLWIAPNIEHFQNLFPLEKVIRPLFYSLDLMMRENVTWHKETRKVYLGERNTSYPPGDADPTKSLLIGDLGPDRMIALDYRKSAERPCVIYLIGDTEARWVEAAPDIDTLLSRL